MNKAFGGAEPRAVGPVLDAPILDCFYRYALDVPVDCSASWLVQMLTIAGTVDRLVHCFWPMTARDDEWLVTELCAGFLQEGADFHGDIALARVLESSALLSQAQLAVGDVRSDEG